MSNGSFRSAMFALLVLGVAAAGVAGAANGRSYGRHLQCPPVGLGLERHDGARDRLRHSSTAGACRAGPTTPWWASDNGTNISTLYSGIGAKAALTVAVPGGPTGTVFNGSATDFVGQPERARAARRGSCSRRRRDDPRLEPGGERHRRRRRRRPFERRRRLQGARDRERPAVRDRLPQRPRRRLRRVVQAGHHGRRLQGPTVRQGLRAVRDPGARRQHLRHVREAGRRAPTTTSPFRARRTSTSSRPTANSSRGSSTAARRTRRSTHRGAWRSRRRTSASSAATSCVGNFGNGRISAYTQRGNTWVYKGQLRLADGTPIAIDGLWAIAFGNGSAAGPTDTLYFLSGPSQEKHGLLGSITVG